MQGGTDRQRVGSGTGQCMHKDGGKMSPRINPRIEAPARQGVRAAAAEGRQSGNRGGNRGSSGRGRVEWAGRSARDSRVQKHVRCCGIKAVPTPSHLQLT